MSKHTPGPWDKTRIGYVHKNGIMFPQKIDDTRLEGESWLEMMQRTQPERDAEDAECKANMNLIAAAPDMMEALEAERDWKTDEERAKAADLRHKAIAKAKGENND